MPAADATQTLEFLNPDLLIASDEAPPAAVPTAEPAEADAPQVLELDPDAPLMLEESAAVDRMLSAAAPVSGPAAASAPPPPASAAASDVALTLVPDAVAPKSAPAIARAAGTKNAGAAAAARNGSATAPSTPAPAASPALVPLARRASLTAAAMKLAAASAAAPAKPVSPTPAAAPATPAAKPRPVPGAATAPGLRAAASSAAAGSAAPGATAAAGAATAPQDAPSLASWANARASAAASGKSAPAPASPARRSTDVKPARPAAAAPSRGAASAAAPAPAPAPAAPAVPASMDRDFIARNQVVERYISGKLPIKAATEFERYCREHPKLLDEIGLPERVNAGLRLLEASGKPEPWQESHRPPWQQPPVFFGVVGFAALLALSLAVVAASSSTKSRKILELQRQVVERTLDAATSTRVIRVLPNRSGASNAAAITIGGGAAQLVDFRIDESRSPYKDFRVTIDRIDQGRVMVIDNLTKDSNGHLRIALNSSALGPGNYQFTIEGLTMRLEPQPDSWVTIGIIQR